MITQVYETANPDYVVVDHNGYRYLMGRNGIDAAHGRMSLSEPDMVFADYIVATMRALLFKPDPADVLIVGLGPGMQVKYLLGHRPDTRVEVVEIDPRMIDIARQYFALATDNDKLRIVIDDGARHVARQNDRYDFIFADSFDSNFSMVESLSNEAYYRTCRRALRRDGILCINVFRQKTEWQQRHLAILQSIFPALLVLEVSPEQTILIVFKAQPLLDLDALAERARHLDPGLNLGLPDFVACLPSILGSKCR